MMQTRRHARCPGDDLRARARRVRRRARRRARQRSGDDRPPRPYPFRGYRRGRGPTVERAVSRELQATPVNPSSARSPTKNGSLPFSRLTIDPAPEPDGATLYAPLAVPGRRRSAPRPTRRAGSTDARNGRVSSGDLKAVEESGTEYSAREVISAEATGEGVRMTVSTNDPSGDAPSR